jgi:GNAT superfamily N-acetyltransferase
MTRLPIKYFFIKPGEISAVILDQIHDLIQRGGGVGTSHIRANLQNAHLIGYAIHKDRVVGTSTHKHPKIEYRKKIEALTGLNLSGFLERGYTTVDPEYRGQAIGGKLIRGLIRKSKGEKIYVTIRMDNTPPLKMTWHEGMVLAAKFLNKNTNQEIGVFTNQGDFPEL